MTNIKVLGVEDTVDRYVGDYVKSLPEENRKKAREYLDVMLKDNKKLFLDYITATKKVHTELARQIPDYDYKKDPTDSINDHIKKAGLNNEQEKKLRVPYEEWLKTRKPFEKMVSREAQKHYPPGNEEYPEPNVDAVRARKHVNDAAKSAVENDLKKLQKKQPEQKKGENSSMHFLLKPESMGETLRHIAELSEQHAGNDKLALAATRAVKTRQVT